MIDLLFMLFMLFIKRDWLLLVALRFSGMACAKINATNSPIQGPQQYNKNIIIQIKLADICYGDEPWMNLGMDGMQPHVQGSATPADLFKRTIAGPLRNWSEV